MRCDVMLSPEIFVFTICGFTIHTDRIENSRVRRTLVFRRRDFSPISILSSQFRCSTSTSDGTVTGPAPPQKNLLVDSHSLPLGLFSKEEEKAAVISNYKVIPKSENKNNNADLVVNLLRDYSLNNTQINDVVSSHPKILTWRAKETLEPRLRVLRDLGVSGSDLVQFIKKKSLFFRLDLDIVDYLRQLLGSDDEKALLKAISNLSWTHLPADALKMMEANVMLLQNYGFSIDKINIMIVRHPLYFVFKTFEGRMLWVVEELGIPCDSSLFIYGLGLAVRFSKPAIEEKMQVFRSFGWSQSELYRMLRMHPFCLTRSAASIRKTLEFFMTELNYAPLDLAKNPVLFTLSLEKRLKPRYEVLKILNDKKLINGKPSLSTVAKYNEHKFLDFVQRFETEVPSLCQTYIDSVKNASNRSLIQCLPTTWF